MVREHFHPFDKDILSFSKEFARPTGEDTVYAHDTMIIMFTSGTTKHPKMVAHNHLYALGHYITARYWHNVKTDGIHLQYPIPAGVRLSGASSMVSGYARLVSLFMILMYSVQTIS